MRLYPLFFKVVFSRMDAERAHHLGFAGIAAAHRTGVGAIIRRFAAPDPVLTRTVMGIDFPSPFGLAAGFDKQGKDTLALFDLGFGHVEVGTITAQGQPGNPKPRLFRLVPDAAVINRMGFNNDGALRASQYLFRVTSALRAEEQSHRPRPVVGINIGKTKVTPLEDADEDYAASARALAPLADYLVVNVSSPNTPGLRQLQHIEELRPLLRAVRAASEEVCDSAPPLLVKVAPDLSDDDVDAVAHLALDEGLDGIIATNTTITREGLVSPAADIDAAGPGGLSGDPLAGRSLEVLKRLRAATDGRLALISVGGVRTPDDVLARLEAGADLVQGYTAFLYEGPFWAARINRALKRTLRGNNRSAVTPVASRG